MKLTIKAIIDADLENNEYKNEETYAPFKKESLLRYIKILYNKSKGKYIENYDNRIEAIKTNADNIIEDIENNLLESIKKNSKIYKLSQYP
ncbi:MAG: hypothetical protein JRJ44_02610 [Deltaproteobacteria bacterium]|nr:hypothetical protein [Deltaproteobacteria bacterium]